MTDERLAKAYQAALATRATGERRPCVAPEALLALARREGAEGQRLATLDHVMACDACRRELDVLLALDDAGARLGRAATGPGTEGSLPPPMPLSARRTRGRATGVVLALAATVLVVVGASVVSRVARPPVELPDVTRGEAGDVVAERPAAGEIVALPVTFTWRPVPGASRYTVEVLAGDGRVVWSAETAEPTATLLEAPALEPGEYRWWVRVTGGASHQSGSAPRALRVRAR
jgi:hypothetical protein